MGAAQSGAPALVREGSGCARSGARSESPRRTAPMPHFERRAFTTSRFVISGATRCGGRIGGGDDKKAGAAQSWAAARSVLLPSRQPLSIMAGSPLVREGGGRARSEPSRRTASMSYFEYCAFTARRFARSGAARCGGGISGGDDNKAGARAGAAQSRAAARPVLL
jgi:hypothetical protein